MRRWSRIAGGVALLALALAPAAPARAEFGSIRLVSKIIPEQAPKALSPAISSDGRYVAFEGTLEGLSGVFRADLRTGIVARVATGDAYEAGAPGADAQAPSISASGRYVSFTTRTRLDPNNDMTSNTRDVYVADMSTAPPSYELASARDGSTLALAGNSAASGRVALSADGRRVAFLNGEQVQLRDLDARRTILVSVRRDPETGAMEPDVPVPGGGAAVIGGLPLLNGAALSADGTTVAWVGTNLPEQVPLLGDEEATIRQRDAGSFPYDEPLWRRVADGPDAKTRRVVGGGDPLAPGCPGAGGNLAEPACRGPFPGIATKTFDILNSASGWLGVAGIHGIPRLSADGRRVALIGNPTEATNAFLVDMGAGLSRRQAVRQLTAQVPVQPFDEGPVVNQEPYVPLNGHIYDIAISPNGGRIAFATARQLFPLAPPNLIGAPPTQLGLVELYVLDLETDALVRVTHGAGGDGEASLASSGSGRSGDGSAAPSLDAVGRSVAFSSSASNLVEGDGNEAEDVFVVEDGGLPPVAGTVRISPPLGERTPRRLRRLALSAVSLRGGNVKLIAVVPGPGRLRARARTLPQPRGGLLRFASRSRRLAGAGRRARKPTGGPVRMILELPRRYRRFARSREGIYAIARVAFHGRRGKPLRGQLEVRFKVRRGKRGGKR
jgi:Tol biopolymer transport system component